MQALTRWVLAHKRLVTIFWVVLTLVGMASAGSATKALKQKFSVPGKEGWVTNQEIARQFHGTGGDTSPLLPVVTLPAGTTVRSPGVSAELAALEAKVEKVLPGGRVAGYAATHNSAFVSKDGRTTFIVAYPRPTSSQSFGNNPEAAKKVDCGAFKGVTIAGAPVHVTGYRCPVRSKRRRQRAGCAAWRLSSAGSERCWSWPSSSARSWPSSRLMMAVVSILTTFLVVWGLTTAHRCLADRPVPRSR